MRDLGRRSALLGLGTMLSGCGWHAVYAPRDGVPGGSQSQLATIRISPMYERSGQLVQEALQERLDHGEARAKLYELTVNFSLTQDIVGVQQDTSFTRLRMVGTANWTLRSTDPSKKVVTTGLARSLDGVNILDQQYFEVDLAGESAQRRLAASIADQVSLQLAAYFARPPTVG